MTSDDKARKAFEDKYFISSSVKWDGHRYKGRDELAEKEAVIINNWLTVWLSAVQWVNQSNQ